MFFFFDKKKQRKANKGEESDIEENDELQVDLENFLIVDSVGDVNGGELSFNDESDENTPEIPVETKPVETVSRDEINVGNEHVKKIDVLYCELCRYYLPHLEDPEAALQKHCSTRNHLRAYLRYKENQSLKITAELIHRRDHKEKHPKRDCKRMILMKKWIFHHLYFKSINMCLFFFVQQNQVIRKVSVRTPLQRQMMTPLTKFGRTPIKIVIKWNNQI